jgi:translocator protein
MEQPMTNTGIASPGQLRMSLLRWALGVVPLIVVLGSASGLLSGSAAENGWYQALQKPSWNPPGWIFGVVWPILYALMGLSLAMILNARGSAGRTPAIAMFMVQLAANLLWSPLFFGMHQVSTAFWVLLVMLGSTIITALLFSRIRRIAALLLLPYIAWMCFAAFLNFEIDQLNPNAETLQAPAGQVSVGIGAKKGN